MAGRGGIYGDYYGDGRPVDGPKSTEAIPMQHFCKDCVHFIQEGLLENNISELLHQCARTKKDYPARYNLVTGALIAKAFTICNTCFEERSHNYGFGGICGYSGKFYEERK